MLNSKIMKNRPTISGYGYVRNGFSYGVPFLESILSVLSICDEFIAVVGDSTDGTREAIVALNNPKIKIVDTVWDENLKKDGKVFAIQSNTGLSHCTGDWVFHIQADEVIHEKDLPKIVEFIQKYNNDTRVDGFLQPFLHFWGDYGHIRNSRRVHRNEIRIFKNSPQIRAYRDSQGFRKFNSIQNYENGTEKGTKLNVIKLDAPIFHYNAVKNPRTMMMKAHNFTYYYGHQEKVLHEAPEEKFNYHQVDRVTEFKGTHPKVMEEAIRNYTYKFEHDTSKAEWKTKDKYLQKIEDFLGVRFFEYKNYKLIK